MANDATGRRVPDEHGGEHGAEHGGEHGGEPGNGRGRGAGRGRPAARVRPGRAGGSARAEYERRVGRDDATRRARFGPLAPLVRRLAGPRSSTDAWARGAEGEELVGQRIDRLLGSGGGIALHDRRRPAGRGNLDHLAVVESGVWVIDTKHYRGRLVRRQVGGWFTAREALLVGRRDVTRLLESARLQLAAVQRVLEADVPVHAALCFTGVELPLFARPFEMEGVLVTWTQRLDRLVRARGPLGRAERAAAAERLDRAFPPYRSGAYSSRPGVR